LEAVKLYRQHQQEMKDNAKEEMRLVTKQGNYTSAAWLLEAEV
jgi:hypothetical protein